MVSDGKRQDRVTAAWAARAEDLAAWAWHYVVVRHDVWGGYLPLARRDPKKGLHGPTTKPRVADRGKTMLTLSILAQHFVATRSEHVIGLHSTSPENTSKWGALDIDCHEGSTALPEHNLAAALTWYWRLRVLGFLPLLTDSNGKGGYHLLAIFREPVPTPRVYAFLNWLTADYATHGLTSPAETFPKQPRIGAGKYGNWLRLPGRHHTRDHWSRVWGGSTWLDGDGAIDHLLSLTGDDPGLIPAEVVAEAERTQLPPPAERKTFRMRMRRSGCSPQARISAYMARLPHLAGGQGRDDVAFNFAAFLVRDLRLTDDSALAWLKLWDQGNNPPKGEARLEEIIKSAHAYGTKSYGSGLGHDDVAHVTVSREVG